MKKIRIFLLIVISCSLFSTVLYAQSHQAMEYGSFETTIIFNGEASNIAYYVPEDYNPANAYKLIVGLHYCTGSPSAYMSYRDLLKPLSDSLNAIIMCPDCHMGGYPYNIPDSSIIPISTDSARALFHIEEEYIYLTGGSCNGKTVIKYGLEDIYDYRGIIAFNPFIPSIPNGYFNYDSKRPISICSGTQDPSYNRALKVYDSLVAHQAHAKMIAMEGIGHDFWIPDFNVEMMNSIRFIDSITDMITAISGKNKEIDKMIISPNPASEKISIKFLGGLDGYKANGEIFSLSGSLLFKFTTDESRNVVELSNLTKGLYIIQVNVNGYLFKEKFIKY